MNTTPEILQTLIKQGRITDYNIQTSEIFADQIIGIKAILTVFIEKIPTVSTGYASGTAQNMEETLEQALHQALKKSSINNLI